MLLEREIKEVINYQQQYLQTLPSGITREIADSIDISQNFITILSGIRRSGKSTLMLQLARGFSDFNFCNFEDPRLSGFEVNDFFKLERAVNPDENEAIWFFDEIQNVKGWEQFIRVLHDKKSKVVVSGSNASLLSKELGTSLTGRHLSYEVYPFSFTEFLNYENLDAGKEPFENYIRFGGFPEYLSTRKEQVLTQLYNDLIYRDIVVRYGLRNADIVRELGVYLATNTGKEFSYLKLANTFNLGSVNTIQSYISYFEDAFLFFTVPRFSYSVRQQAKNPKKIYGVDTGMMNLLSLSFSKDLGRMLENAVYIELRRQGKKVFYFRNTGECDFIVANGKVIDMPIQVCYSLTGDNLDREVKGVIDALKSLKLNSGLILTMDQDDELDYKGYKIIVKPVWKWMTETK